MREEDYQKMMFYLFTKALSESIKDGDFDITKALPHLKIESILAQTQSILNPTLEQIKKTYFVGNENDNRDKMISD